LSERNTAGAKVLALELAGIAGFVDVVGYLTLHHLFTAHLTGNASKLGVALGQGHLADAGPLAAVPVLFALGVALGTVAADAGRAWLALAAQFALVAAFMGYGSTVVHHGAGPAETSASFYALAALATVSLGLQTAALTRIDGSTVRTSYVSGTITRLAQSLVRRDGDAPLALLAAIPFLYLAGATLGAWTLGRVGVWCLGVPLGALALGCVVAARVL
jgi:uncharacterized membrane protein YoaK (UPF0700 family)